MRKRTEAPLPCKRCGKPARYTNLQLCAVHYQLHYAAELERTARLGFCECGNPVIIKNLCSNCYEKQWRSQWRQMTRDQVLKEYGGKCSCSKCPETNPEFLTLDHIFRDGAADRKSRKNAGGINFWRQVLLEGCPKKRYRLLCWNCNVGRERFKGICPHEEDNDKLH